jgi:hypothetical protein
VPRGLVSACVLPDEKKINGFVLYAGTGKEPYKPKEE